MPLWKKSTSAASRPKWMPDDSNADNAREFAFADTRGWCLRPGVKGTGNDNTSAQAEVLACVSGLSTTLGAANVLSVDFTATTTLAHDGTGTFDLVYTFDEALTVTSATWSADQVISNKLYVVVNCIGPTDMASDVAMKLQYYSGSGTNELTLRGTVPAAAVTDGYIGDLSGTYAMVTDGTSAVVDKNGTTVTACDGDHDGGSAVGGPDAGTAIFGAGVKKTGSTVNTLTATDGTSSGTDVEILTGVQFA